MKKLSAGALEVLSTRLSYRDETVKISGALPRALYLEVNAALEALGAKWDKKWKAHIFKGKAEMDIRSEIQAVVFHLGFVDKKKELQQFFTPRDIADLLVKLADIQPGHMVLEPSAGSGMIVDAVRRAFGDPEEVCIYACEVDTAHQDALTGIGANVLVFGDFLTMVPSPTARTTATHLPGGLLAGFDRIVMNPPFGKKQGIAHVEHAFKFLAPGGRLVSVLDAGVTFRGDKRTDEFREFCVQHSVLADLPLGHGFSFPGSTMIEGPFLHLPTKAFAASGTNVSTVAIVLERPR